MKETYSDRILRSLWEGDEFIWNVAINSDLSNLTNANAHVAAEEEKGVKLGFLLRSLNQPDDREEEEKEETQAVQK